jgi:hypothetical protein
MPVSLTKPTIFISYAHADEPASVAEGEIKWLSFVTSYLRPAVKLGAVDIWMDRLLQGGDDWDREILRKLQDCDIFVLLVSAQSMSSDYIVKEIAIIRERQAKGEAVRFFPLLLKPTPKIALDLVRDKNLRPRDARPFSEYSLSERDRQMSEVADEIAAIAEEIAVRGSRSSLKTPTSWGERAQRISEALTLVPARRSLKISVACEDALEFDADVLVLKYAQKLHGVDRAAVNRVIRAGSKPVLPKPGRFWFENTFGKMCSRNILLVGVKPLEHFSYEDIRDFAWGALSFLSREAPNIKSIALTIHGANYGLDEVEAFNSEIAGLIDAVSTGSFPLGLESIAFVEKDNERTRRLQVELKGLFPDGVIRIDDQGSVAGVKKQVGETLRTAGSDSSSKPFVFVAMPFIKEMDDVFHYGIHGAVKSAGFLCERADLSAFTGDILQWVKNKIAGSTIVVADLSHANPNVYLEVGYAWGCNIPTILIVRDSDELKFDVRGHKCLRYDSIRTLEDNLRNELRGLLNQE